ncbi:MAG: arylsulfatase [Planctomycetota bacterium]
MSRFTHVVWLLVFASVYQSAAADKPNIVFILADDLGLGDVSFHARTLLKKEPIVETPTMDALASQGMWFTDGHSSTALCAPTRYAVMSGNNNYRSYAPWGVWSTFGRSAFPDDDVTLGSVVRDAGYSTGFVGKWHLGGDFAIPGSREFFRGKKNGDLTGMVDLTQMVSGGPRDCGFDYDFTAPCGIQGPIYLLYENQTWYPLAEDSQLLFLNDKTIKQPEDLRSKGPGMGDSNWNARELGKLLSSKAVQFIQNHQDSEQPFFLYYCSPMVHRPHRPTDEFDNHRVKGATPSAHLDMLIDLDLQIKRIVNALKKIGEYENTLLIVSSDNGGLRDPIASKVGYQPGGGWNGSKNSPLEGGHRVPLFAVWPGQIEPGITDELAVTHDMVATFAALAGTSLPDGQALDSNNLLPLLIGEGTFQTREYFVQQAGSEQQVMFRRASWKLIMQSNFKRSQCEPIALYDLEHDPHEDTNLLNDVEASDRSRQMLDEYLAIVESGRPTAPGR